MKPISTLPAAAFVVLATAFPAAAAPSPSPGAPMHTGTACANVIAHNPQATDASHSAPPAQENFANLGSIFCGA